MHRGILVIIFLLVVSGCMKTALVEIGFNDEGAVNMPGDIVLWITEIEFPVGRTLWRGYQPITVSISDKGFVSATGTYYEIDPGYYRTVRVCVDSVRYVNDTVSALLVETPYRFAACTSYPIYFDGSEEVQLVISIRTDRWLDFDEADLKDGHYPFEGAQLNIYYQ